MDQATKNDVKRMVLALRQGLESDVETVLRRYGIFTNRDWLSVEQLPEDATLREKRQELATIIEVETARGISRQEAVQWYVREVAFTFLNRLVGLKCLEVRELISEVITTRPEYGGRSLWHRDYRHEHPDRAQQPDDALPGALRAAFDRVDNEMIGVLFDNRSESSAVWPRHRALREAIALINELPRGVWQEDEIIGWIYQFYNTEEKARIRRQGRGKLDLPIEVAIINQFFTPRWIVKFLVDNTLGRVWLEMHPDSTRVRTKCDHLVPEYLASKEKDLERFAVDPHSPINNPVVSPTRAAKPVTELRLIDPACGTMHFGHYAFEVFQEIYRDARDHGWPIWDNADRPAPTEREVPTLILAHNLYGVDIDLRAIQLAALSLYMKARVAEQESDLTGEQIPQVYRVNLVSADARLTNGDLRKRFLEIYADDPKLLQVWEELFKEMEDIAQVGSLLQIEERFRQLLEAYKPTSLERRSDASSKGTKLQVDPKQMNLREAPGGEYWQPQRTVAEMLKHLHEFAQYALEEEDINTQLFVVEAEKTLGLLDVLTQEYDVVVMNPPFGYAMSTVKAILDRIYPNWCNNLLAAFYIRATSLVEPDGYIGMVSDKTFADKKSYEPFRRECFLSRPSMLSFLDLGWEVLDDANVEVCAFVTAKQNNILHPVFIDLNSASDQPRALQESISAIQTQNMYRPNASNLSAVPFGAFAYKSPHSILKAFGDYLKMNGNYAYCPSGGIDAPANEYYRYHWEVPPQLIDQNGKFATYWNGWSGHTAYHIPIEQVFLWEYDGSRAMQDPRSRYSSVEYFFSEGIGWGKRGTILDVGYLDNAIFSKEGQALFPYEEIYVWPLIGLLNSKLAQFTVNLYCGLHKTGGYVGELPVAPQLFELNVGRVAQEAYDLKAKWDTGNEISSHFCKPWILQHLEGTLLEVPQRTSITVRQSTGQQSTTSREKRLFVVLDSLATYEQSADGYLEQAQVTIDKEIYSLYRIPTEDRMFVDAELVDRPATVIWPQMRGKSSTEKRREHVRRLLSYFVLESVKTDDDGIVPLFPGMGEATILERLRVRLIAEFGEEAAFQMEDDVGKILGRSVANWLDGQFIRWHTKLYNKRPILWHIASPRNRFAVILYYHKLDCDTLRKVRNVYLRRAREAALRALGQARDEGDEAEASRQEELLDDYHVLDERLERVISGTVGYRPPKWAEGPYRNGVYDPVIDDGVKVNLMPLQKGEVLRYKTMI